MSANDLYELGVVLAGEAKVGGAIEALEGAVELDADHAQACKLLARLSLQINERRAFVNWCHEASRIDPNDPEPYQMMADELTRVGRHEEANEAREAAARRNATREAAARRNATR